MVRELLERGEMDWVMAAEIAPIVKMGTDLESDECVRHEGVKLVRAVLEAGWMVIGHLTDGGFLEWDEGLFDAADRVEKEWNELGRLPKVGELFWLSITEEGRRHVRILQ